MATSRVLTVLRVGVSLVGTPDGVLRIFQTPEKFQRYSVRVYHNGRSLVPTQIPMPNQGDFFVSESGGTGTGFDTINFLTMTPSTSSVIRVDYQLG